MKSLRTFALAAVVATAAATKPTVKTGLDVLIESNYKQLSGRKVLILSNPTGITPDMDLGVDVMFESKKVNMVGVMGPEHGFRGTSQAGGGESTFKDPKTGLTVYDAYNVNVTTLMGYIRDSGADTIVYDIQDVGARFYTYIWALYDTMVAAAATNTSFIVIDRPNPITALDAHGPVLNDSFINSYVGRRPIAQAHGMTVGELARMYVGEGWIRQTANGSDLEDLSVVKMRGWKRGMTFAETGLPWVFPSPNMPTPDTAMLYPGTCMFEGTSLSEGRGTTRPFELLGAPWANESWVTEMRSLDVPHTAYRFQCFVPTTSKFDTQTACGLQTYVTDMRNDRDYAEFDAPFVGVNLLYAARKLFTVDNTTGEAPTTGAFHWIYGGSSKSIYDVDVLTGSPLVREGIENGLTPDQIRKAWTPRLQEFREKRKKYLLYK
ncbi:secreted protein [Purpureocillium lavendulum]|uniref:Secreted protein n=1 Tax=Purpureocillium lavendulum TaxID=1247861 RepID=A0AB34G107_9HYPO|nr:secreted protein [Purpureocillium lavendulum]